MDFVLWSRRPYGPRPGSPKAAADPADQRCAPAHNETPKKDRHLSIRYPPKPHAGAAESVAGAKPQRGRANRCSASATAGPTHDAGTAGRSATRAASSAACTTDVWGASQSLWLQLLRTWRVRVRRPTPVRRLFLLQLHRKLLRRSGVHGRVLGRHLQHVGRPPRSLFETRRREAPGLQRLMLR